MGHLARKEFSFAPPPMLLDMTLMLVNYLVSCLQLLYKGKQFRAFLHSLEFESLVDIGYMHNFTFYYLVILLS